MTTKETYVVTAGGVFGALGELRVGYEFESAGVPLGLEGKIRRKNGDISQEASLVVATPQAAIDAMAKNYQAMSVADLKELASTRQIDLDGATKKDDIIAKLSAVTADAEIQPSLFSKDSSQQEQKIDRTQLEKSATTLGVQFTAETTDEELYAKVTEALGD